MPTRTGKIARLPAAVRQQLNLRLDDGQEGPPILDWLNALPEVQALLQEKFGGAPISPQNLSQWRQGGFQDWLLLRELCGEAQALADSADESDKEFPHGTAAIDHAATVLGVRFGSLLMRWNGEVDEPLEAKARFLNGVCRSVVRLQRAVHDATQARFEEQRQREAEQDRQREKKRKKLLGPIQAKEFAGAMAHKYGGDETARKFYEGYYNLLTHDFESPLKLWHGKDQNTFPDKDMETAPQPQPNPTESHPIKPNQSSVAV